MNGCIMLRPSVSLSKIRLEKSSGMNKVTAPTSSVRAFFARPLQRRRGRPPGERVLGLTRPRSLERDGL